MKIVEMLSQEEIARFSARSDVNGAWLLACQWGLLAVIFGTVAAWPNAMTVVLGVLLLGGRQLGFGNLRGFHEHLREAGVYAGVEFPSGYLELLRRVTYGGPERVVA